MTSGIQLRKAQLQDAPLVAEIATSTFRETYTGMMAASDIEQYVTETLNLGSLEKALSDPRQHFWLALKEGAVIGYGSFQEGNPPIDLPERRVGEINRIYIKRSYHGLKIGPLFLEKLTAVAETLQLSGLWLSVWQRNTLAQKFYEKHGFVNMGEQTFVVGTDPQKDFILFKKTRV